MAPDEVVLKMKKHYRDYRIKIIQEQADCEQKKGVYDEREWRKEYVLAQKTAEINSAFIAELEREVFLHL